MCYSDKLCLDCIDCPVGLWLRGIGQVYRSQDRVIDSRKFCCNSVATADTA
jgi:hypothetical protein